MGIPMPLFERFAKGTRWKISDQYPNSNLHGQEVMVVREPSPSYTSDAMLVKVVFISTPVEIDLTHLV